MELRPAQSGIPLAQLIDLFAGELVDSGTAIAAAVQSDLVVSGMTVDSRRVQPGDLFAALPGENAHGADFAQSALANGAVAILTDRPGRSLITDNVERVPPILTLNDPRFHVGDAAAEIYGCPADDLLLLGVTGTNGKTTTTWMLEHALRSAGHITGLIGTVESQIAGEPVSSVRTTPEAPELHALLAVMKERGVTAVAMEVSSHAMTMGRVDGCWFDVVGFTQFGSDHIDFHGSIDAYFAAKRSLFSRRYARRAVVCVDSDGGVDIARQIGNENLMNPSGESFLPLTTVGDESVAADWNATELIGLPGGGYTFNVRHEGRMQQARLHLPGRFNVTNALLAAVMLEESGLDVEVVFEALADFGGVPGRMELIDEGQPFAAVVDYAHTPDAMRAILESLRPEVAGRLMIAFGCGGDRDASKRPIMGRLAAELADVVIVTDDNPRSESPATIRSEILHGVFTSALPRRGEVQEVPGRAEAVAELVALAGPGDVLVLAGKGHEQGQEIDGHVYPFDDRSALRAALRDWDLKSLPKGSK